MSIFGFIGTWTLAIQWQHTFKANGVQNVAGILVAGIQGFTVKCSKVATTLQPNLSDIITGKTPQ